MAQVTVKEVQEAWLAKAKREAARRGVSLNQVLLEALARGLELRQERSRATNLDRYAGDSDFGPDWDDFLDRELKQIDEELWK